MNWFDRAFSAAGNAVAEVRHEIMSGWFGRGFEPHPSRQAGMQPEQPGVGERRSDGNSGWFWVNFEPGRTTNEQTSPGERDIHGNERGIER